MSERVKVVRLIPSLDFGGVESRLILQSQLINRLRYDFRVCVLGKSGAAAKEIEALGIPVDKLDSDPSVRSLNTTQRLHEYLSDIAPDVLHASISEGMFHGALAGTSAAVPKIIIEEVGIPGRSALGQKIFGQLYRLADHVVGVSKATCAVLKMEGCPDEKLKLVYNCAHPRFFEESLRVVTDTANFLMVGRLVEVKNHLTMIRAFARLVGAVPSANLRIVGEGPLKASLISEVGRLGIGANVSFLGFREDIRELLLESDFFVLSSFTEGCSISLVEAMTTGIVPLGSRASGIIEVMGDLERELNVEAQDERAWLELLLRAACMRSEERRKIGEAAKEIADSRFSPNVYMENLYSLYDGRET